MNPAILTLPLLLLMQVGETPSPPKLKAQLHAAHASVAPGGTTELAFELEISSPWHVYHPILLGPGLPTTLTFDAPAGVTVGPVRFPVPALGTSLGAEFLGYEHRVVLLAPLTLDNTIKTGTSLAIKANLSALACTDTGCVPVTASATLDLKTSSAAGPDANGELFKKARAALPPPLAKAPYLKGSRALASHTQVPVLGSGELLVVARIEPQHHIQARDPGVEGLIPTRLFIEPIDGIELGKIKWPAAHVRDMKYLGKVREYNGEAVIRVPFTVTDAQFKPGPVSIRLLLQYQTCTDAGACYPPETAEAFVTFDVVAKGSPAVLAQTGVSPARPAAQAGAAEPATTQTPSGGANPSLLLVFLGAFLGGVILNIMPCVLPVISLKIFGFMQQAGEDRGRVFRMGLVYALGIMGSFLVVAIIMVVLSAPWGGLMQYPTFVIVFCGVILALALSLFGVFEIQLPGKAMDAADAAGRREGYGGAFLNGVLATALATPCTAPVLGWALGVLSQLPPMVMGAGILTVGLGLAAPYVLLTAFPTWLRFMPKPGAWMVTFKQIMGFVLLATMVWLLSILIELVETPEFLGTLAFLCGVAMASWLLGRLSLNASAKRFTATWGGVVALLLAGWFGGFAIFSGSWKQIPWQTWEPGSPQQLAAEGYTVYVDYTAVWCLTCLSNKRLVLETDAVREKLSELNIVPLKADFTKKDPDIQKDLRKYGRAGVPLNIVVPAGRPNDVIVLPELLTQKLVIDALEKAGPSLQQPELELKQP